MKRFLFIILVAVAAVLLWAIRAEAYSNGLVFLLGLVVTALSGYLIADYFLRVEKNSLKNNLHISQKENQALKERVDLLQTQLTTATPHAEVEQFEQRLSLLEDEKRKLDGFSRAQTAEIANLREKLEIVQKNNTQLIEDATISSETAKAKMETLQAEVEAAKLELQAIKDENNALQQQNTALMAEQNAKAGNVNEDTEGGDDEAILDDSEPIIAARNMVITDLDEETEGNEDVTTTEDFGTSDNLQAIEGIGPKIDALLKEAEISTWEKLSMTTPERLRVVLDNGGKQYQHVDPTSWIEQARLLVHGEFSKLKKYKEHVVGN